MRTSTRILLVVACVATMSVDCKKRDKSDKGLDHIYCKGGLGPQDQPRGTCMGISDGKPPGSSPDTIGAASWLPAGGSGDIRVYAIQPAGPNKYQLSINGELKGSMERDGNQLKINLDEQYVFTSESHSGCWE